jgi:geranylgeranyl pyrophosphate synthase
MWKDKQRQLLREEVLSVLSGLPGGLSNIAKEPLMVSRRGLASILEEELPWVLLPLVVYESISHNTETALPLCASLQFFMAAGDVFDDIEDNDAPLSLSSKYGTAITNNIATTLLVLGEKAIARLKYKKLDDNKIVRMLDIINSYYLTACAGQHKDLLYGKQIDISENEYLAILGLKSASQIECACYTGALLATENEELLNIFKDFGYNLGMMTQIVNDISGILSNKDIQKRKITLPIIYALNQTSRYDNFDLRNYYLENGENISSEQIKQILSNIGAIHYAAIKMESYKLFALKSLDNAKQMNINVDKLREFIK